MSRLEKSVNDLSNEEIVNSLLEDFQNDISLHSAKEKDTHSNANLNDNDSIPLTSDVQSNVSNHLQQEPNVLEPDGDRSETYSKNTANNLSEIMKEKDPDEGEKEVDDNPCEDISDNEGADDTSLSEEEIKKLELASQELKNEGNELFKQNLWQESLAKYNEALRMCPKSCSTTRSVFYANRAAVYEKLEKTDLALSSCTKALALNPSYLKVWTRRARLYQSSDKLDEALADYQKILELDPHNRDACFAAQTLPQQINERNEKLKEEMLGKLKDLGNMILRPFGLSTNNFQMVQDPNSGGYSINFNQNAPPS